MRERYTALDPIAQAEISSDDSWMDRIQVTEGTLTRSQERAERIRKAIELRTAKILSSHDQIACGRGRKDSGLVVDRVAMANRPGGLGPTLFKEITWQVPGSYETFVGTLEDLHREVVVGESGIGPKHQAVTIYAGPPLEELGPPSKVNCGPSHILTIDLDDGALRDQRDLARLREWLSVHQLGYSLYSTASYSIEVPKIRLILLWDLALAYDEHRIAARRMLARIQAHIGTDQGWDKCSTVPSHPMHVARWTTPEAESLAIQEFRHGRSWPVSLELEAIREELMEARIAEEARLASFAAAGDLTGVISLEDRVSEARHEIHTSGLAGIRPGEGRTDSGMWDAARCCASWGLDAEQIEAVLVSLFGDVDSKILSHKASEAARLVRPWRLLKAAGQRRAAADDHVFDEVEEIGVSSPRHTCSVNIYETTSVTDKCDAEPLASIETALGSLPLEKIHSRYLPTVEDFGQLPKGLLFVRSACGTGKNASLRPAWDKLQADGERGIGVSHRISLARAQSGAWSLPCYQDSKGEITGTASVCLNSLPRVAWWELGDEEVKEIPMKVAVLDEIQQQIRHAFSSASRKSGATPKIIKAIRMTLLESETCILQDADMTGLTFRVLKRILGDRKIEARVQVNTWRPSNLEAVLYEDKAVWLKALKEEVKTGSSKKAIPCTSRAAASRLHRILEKDNPRKRGLLIHQGTVGLPEVRACLEDPRLFDQYDWIAYSPSISAGVSIDIPETWEVWGHVRTGDGSIAQDVFQGLSRVRNPVGPWRIFVGRGPLRFLETDPAKILEDLTILCKKSLRLLEGLDYDVDLSSGQISVDDPALLYCYAEVLAYEARWGILHRMKDGRQGALAEHLRASGVRVEWDGETASPAEKEAQQAEEAAAKLEVDEEEAELVEEAPDITDEEREELSRQPSTPETEAKVIRHDMAKFYGEKEISKEKVLHDRRGKRRQEIAFEVRAAAWRRGHQAKVKEIDKRSLAGEGDHSILNCSHRAAQADLTVRLWSAMGIDDVEKAAKQGIELKIPQGPIDPSLREEIRRTLIPTLKADTTWGKLASVLAGRGGYRLAKPEQRRQDGKRIRSYRLDADSVMEVYREGASYLSALTGEEATAWEPAPMDDEAMIEALLD